MIDRLQPYIDRFHEYSAKPVAILAVFSPAWIPSDLAPWLSIALQVGGLFLIVVQIRYWWRKRG